MMSGPALLSMATVVRAWISFMLIVSSDTLAPLCFSNAAICFFRSASCAGTKFTHCRNVSRVPRNCPGACPALTGRTPPSIAAPAATPVRRKNARRFSAWAIILWLNIEWSAMTPPPICWIPLSPGNLLRLIDLFHLGGRPLDGFLGRSPLDGLGVHVHDDIFRCHFGRLAAGGSGIAELPSVLGDIL